MIAEMEAPQQLDALPPAEPSAVGAHAPPNGLAPDLVRRMRKRRDVDGLSWDELAGEFGVHRKTAYRICCGKTRLDAGGPIEETTDPEAVYCKCGRCGCRVIMPCQLCFLETSEAWVRLAVRLLLATGIPQECEGRLRLRRPRLARLPPAATSMQQGMLAYWLKRSA